MSSIFLSSLSILLHIFSCFISLLTCTVCNVMDWAQIASAHLPLYILSLHIFLPPALFCLALSTYQRLVATHTSVRHSFFVKYLYISTSWSCTIIVYASSSVCSYFLFVFEPSLFCESNGASVYDTLKDHTCDVRSKI